jgi:hypothetical protein
LAAPSGGRWRSRRHITRPHPERRSQDAKKCSLANQPRPPRRSPAALDIIRRAQQLSWISTAAVPHQRQASICKNSRWPATMREQEGCCSHASVRRHEQPFPIAEVQKPTSRSTTSAEHITWLLSDSPVLSPMTVPFYQSIAKDARPWPMSELKRVPRASFSQTITKANIGLFMGALDECSGSHEIWLTF